MREVLQLICSKCGISFEKEKREYVRQISKGRNKDRFFCSISCHASEEDEFSPFRVYVSTARKNARLKQLDFNLTVSHLKFIWDTQKGICPYLGVNMHLDKGRFSTHNPAKASLDRIDSSKGYVEGNVEFVCIFVNLGKNGYRKEQILSLLQKQNLVK